MQANPSSSDKDVFYAIQHEWQKALEENKRLKKEVSRLRDNLRNTRIQRTIWIAGIVGTVIVVLIEKLG